MIWVAGSQEYRDHLEEQNVCKTCEEHFENRNNLDQVSRNFILLESKLTLVTASNGAFKTIHRMDVSSTRSSRESHLMTSLKTMMSRSSSRKPNFHQQLTCIWGALSGDVGLAITTLSSKY
jgi:hypothetical protein